jgi:hypothetical protein
LEAFKNLDIRGRSRSPELYALGPYRFEDETQELLRAASKSSSPQDTNKDGSVSKTTSTSADTSSRQDLQGPTVASEGARTAYMISVNKVNKVEGSHTRLHERKKVRREKT